MKKWMALLLTLLMLLSMAACAGETAEEVTEVTEETTEVTEEVTEVTEETTEPVMPEMAEPVQMEQIEWIEDVPADAATSYMGGDTLYEPADRAGLSDPLDPNRPWYDLGTCRQLEGDVAVLVIYLNDAQSSWTLEEQNAFRDNKLYPGVTWLTQQAANWGASFNYVCAHYGAPEHAPRYNGVAGDFNPNYSADILEQAARSLGFATKEAMHQCVKDFFKREKVAYVIALDKPGRCYAMLDPYNDGLDFMEYCVLYDDDLQIGNGYYYSCSATTVAHEMLHLFGAEDFYSDGTVRAGRAKLAAQYYPSSVMLTTYLDMRYQYVDGFTAYAVGWTDTAPSVCFDANWWK